MDGFFCSEQIRFWVLLWVKDSGYIITGSLLYPAVSLPSKYARQFSVLVCLLIFDYKCWSDGFGFFQTLKTDWDEFVDIGISFNNMAVCFFQQNRFQVSTANTLKFI